MRWEHTDPDTLSLVVGSRKLAFAIPDPKALSGYSRIWDLLRQSNQVLSEAYTSIKMGQAPGYEGMFENVKTLLLEMDTAAREMVSHSLQLAGWAGEPEQARGVIQGLNLEQAVELTNKFIEAVHMIQRGDSKPMGNAAEPAEQDGESSRFTGPARPRSSIPQPASAPDGQAQEEPEE